MNEHTTAALTRLRLAEAKANDLLWLLADVVQASNALAVATELSAAIDGLENTLRNNGTGQ